MRRWISLCLMFLWSQGMKKLFLSSLLLIFALSMCASAQSNALTSRKWVLTEMNGNKTGETTAFIKFSSLPARFSGNSGCNLMSGNAHFRGNRLSFSEVITTKRACMQGRHCGITLRSCAAYLIPHVSETCSDATRRRPCHCIPRSKTIFLTPCRLATTSGSRRIWN